MRLGAVALVLAVACGGNKPTTPPEKRDAGVLADAQPPDVVPAKPLGMPDLASYGWRKRGGHAAFRDARAAEARGDWPAVVATCEQVLAADPGHLEAAWLLAAGLGRLGKLDRILAPLQVAAAGDFGKWGPASLELPALAAFRATPLGQAWQRRVEQDRALYVAALARAAIVMSEGDLFAFDPREPRWYRLTRTHGTVIGALRVTPTKIAYVSRQRARDKKGTTLAIGLVDLRRGKSSRPVELDTRGPITIVYSPKLHPGIWIGSGRGPRPTTWRRFDDDFRLTALPPKPPRPRGPRLEVTGKTVRLVALPVSGITADWDEHGLASAARIVKSNRIVTAPSPGLIDGHTVVWSPDRARLAFVAQLDDTCAPGAVNAAAFVADATTGVVQELERGVDGLAVDWLDANRILVAGDNGVTLVELGGTSRSLDGADGVVMPRHQPSCTPADDADPGDPDLPPVEESEAAESASGEPGDAGVVDAR